MSAQFALQVRGVLLLSLALLAAPLARSAAYSMDANTTEQVAQGYKELKMEVGATQTSVLGVSQGAKGGVGLDTMVQRLVQTAVYEIDSRYK